jgi:hypothetical protein
MRKVFALLISLLIPAFAWADQDVIVKKKATAAPPSTFCADATTTSNGLSGRLCEDFQGSSPCFTGGNNYCRNTWTASGTIDDSAHKFVIDGAGAAVEQASIDTGDTSTTFGIFAKIKILALPTTGTNVRKFMAVGTPVHKAYCELYGDGRFTEYAGSRVAAVSTLTAGETYYFWEYYQAASASPGDDGIHYVCMSTSPTRPADPSASADCAYTSSHNEASLVDYPVFTNGYSTTFNSFEVLEVFASTSEIGSNP